MWTVILVVWATRTSPTYLFQLILVDRGELESN